MADIFPRLQRLYRRKEVRTVEKIARISETTAERLTALVALHQEPLLRLCYALLHNEEDARDAVQVTFMKAYRTINDFRGECSEKTWLTRIAVNTCRDFGRIPWRRHENRRITPEDLPEAAASFETEDEDLTIAVMNLPRKWREVILLYYYQRMTVVEIAKALGIAQSSVSDRLKKARERLYEMLTKEDVL